MRPIRKLLTLLLAALLVTPQPIGPIAQAGPLPAERTPTAHFSDSGQRLGSAAGADVALGDVDGDGDLDAVIANYDGPSRLWRNQGGQQNGAAGNFVSGQALAAGPSVSVALGDLDGDGDLDIFLLRDSAGDSNEVWLNQGGAQGGTPGLFAASGQTFGHDLSSDVALGPLDGDTSLDAFVTRSVGRPDKVWVNSGGVFTDTGQSLGADSGADVALGDVDGDGDLDAFVAGSPNRLWLNQGGLQDGTAGAFQASGQSIAAGGLALSVALVDVDFDDDPDIFVGKNGANELWINQGGGQSGLPGNFADSGQRLGNSPTRSVAFADLDGDGDADAFFANNGANEVWHNQGLHAGVFVDSGQRLGNGFSEGLALGDVDGDGDVDAFVANWDGPDEVWLNHGPALPPPTQPIPNGEGWQRQVVSTHGLAGEGAALALDSLGYPHIAYVRKYFSQYEDDWVQALWYARWDGVRWIDTRVETGPSIITFGGHVSIQIDSNDRPHIAYPGGEWFADLQLRYLRWDGSAWQRQVVDSKVDEELSLALDGNDRAFISYEKRSALWLAAWDGAAWEMEQVSGADTVVRDLNSLALDSQGEPHLLFIDNTRGIVMYARRGPSGWTLETVESSQFIGDFGSLALDHNDIPHVSYLIPYSTLRYARRTATGWQAETLEDNIREAQISLAVDAGGNPHIAFLFSPFPRHSLDYLRWDGANWQRERLDLAARLGESAALALDAQGRPHIAYADGQYGDLRYVSRAPRWQSRAVENSGPNNGLALGQRDDAPILAYHRGSSGQLTVNRWNDGWQADSLRSLTPATEHTSLVVSDRQLHLTYYDAAAQRLVYATSQESGVWGYRTVDESGNAGQYNRLIWVFNDSRLLSVYWDAASRRVKLARIDAGQPIVISANPMGPPLNENSGRLAAAGLGGYRAGVIYHDAANSALRYAEWDPVEGWTRDELVDGQNSDVGRVHDLQAASVTHTPAAAYYDATSGVIRYAVRENFTWQAEIAVVMADVTAISLELGLGSIQRPRIAFATQSGGLFVAIKGSAGWTVESVAAGGTGLTGLDALVNGRMALAYAGSGLQYAYRTATLDVNTEAYQPPERIHQPPTLLQMCAAFIAALLSGEEERGARDARQTAQPVRAVQSAGPLSDGAILTALTDLFWATPEGKRYITLYHQHVGELTRLTLADPQLLWDSYGTMQNFLPGLEALVRGDGAEVAVTQAMIDDALSIWQRLAAVGSPALAQAINEELQKSNNLADFKDASFDAWVEQIGVPPPQKELYLPAIFVQP